MTEYVTKEEFEDLLKLLQKQSDINQGLIANIQAAQGMINDLVHMVKILAKLK